MILENLKLVKKFKPVEGTGKNGSPWKRVEFMATTQEKFPVNIVFRAFNLTCAAIDQIDEGDIINVDFMPESREYQGKYYTDVICRGVVKPDIQTKPEKSSEPTAEQKPKPKANKPIDPKEDDGLPF